MNKLLLELARDGLVVNERLGTLNGRLDRRLKNNEDKAAVRVVGLGHRPDDEINGLDATVRLDAQRRNGYRRRALRSLMERGTKLETKLGSRYAQYVL